MTRAESVRALLVAHRPSDPREEEHRGAMLALLDSGLDPFARDVYAPGHFTASAFVTSPDGRAVLLVHHAKLERWLQPGGHFERGDGDLFAAASREVLEETGLVDVEVGELFDLDVHELPALGAQPPHRHFDLRVRMRARAWAVRAGSDAKGARWTDPQLAARDSDDSVLRALRKLFPS